MRKLVTIVGARPQFVKAAILSNLIRGEFSDSFEECLVHTGQHYDDALSAVFFREMEIPEPRVNLGVGSGPQGEQTGQMLQRIERVLMDERPDCVLVYGDTNSTLAGALAAVKLGMKVAHVESGLRSYNRRMPEEVNRVITDHVSTFRYCPTAAARENLEREGIVPGGVVVGDVMFDASLRYRAMARQPERSRDQAEFRASLPERFYLLTLHRAENTDDPGRLRQIVDALNELDTCEGVFPLHPRTRKVLVSNGLSFGRHIHLIEPVGFFRMLVLEEHCEFVVTDSGGVQKEAFFFRKPCITLRDETEWVETVQSGWNTLAGADKRKIREAFRTVSAPAVWPELYGSGSAGAAILRHLESTLENEEERL